MAPPIEDFVAIDCEMVSLRLSSTALALARVGLVAHDGTVLLDSLSYVQHESIANYNSRTSGIKSGDLSKAPPFDEVRNRVRQLIKGKTVVGHALFNDLAVLQIRLPLERTRDTALYYPLRKTLGVTREGDFPSLKKLSQEVLDEVIQGDVHSPVVDAHAAMKLYKMHRDEWERALSRGDDCIAALPAHYAEWYY